MNRLDFILSDKKGAIRVSTIAGREEEEEPLLSDGLYAFYAQHLSYDPCHFQLDLINVWIHSFHSEYCSVNCEGTHFTSVFTHKRHSKSGFIFS